MAEMYNYLYENNYYYSIISFTDRLCDTFQSKTVIR